MTDGPIFHVADIGGFDLSGLPEHVAVGHAVVGGTEAPELAESERLSLGPRATACRLAEFEAGRVAAHRALVRLGVDDQAVPRGVNGEPVWPPGVVGSITHSQDLAIAMTGRLEKTSGIGVDLEHRRSVDEIEGLVAFGSELSWLDLASGDRDDRLLELFAAKESVFKALYPMVGRFFGFEAVRIEDSNNQGVLQAHLLDAGLLLSPGGSVLPVQVTWLRDQVLTWVVLPPIWP